MTARGPGLERRKVERTVFTGCFVNTLFSRYGLQYFAGFQWFFEENDVVFIGIVLAETTRGVADDLLHLLMGAHHDSGGVVKGRRKSFLDFCCQLRRIEFVGGKQYITALNKGDDIPKAR